jgi:uncharacterized protein (TIGR03118 family)
MRTNSPRRHLHRPSRLRLEALEQRNLFSASPVEASGTVLQTNLVSDLPGVAQQQDPQLVNPWGISASSSGPLWVSDNNAGVATIYNPQTNPSKQGLVVSIPAPPGFASFGVTAGAPTGTVFNTSNGGFDVNGHPALFLFDTEDGTIIGWNGGSSASIVVDNSGNNNPLTNVGTGAVYKGLTMATESTPILSGDSASTSLLYAANFRAGTIEVYDANFEPATGLPQGAFTDPHLPKGYAPFDVQLLDGKIFVTYALQDSVKHDDVAGAHHGFVDEYNLDGTPALTTPSGQPTPRLISGGPLDSPWGLAIAPASFGSLAGDLLVGNFGNGHINAFNLNDADRGHHFTQLTDPDGEPIAIDGLWALRVGNGGKGGDANAVYFTAGLFKETHGLFGSLTSVAPGSPEGPAEAEMVTADLDVVELDLAKLEADIAAGAPAATIRQDLQTLRADTAQYLRALESFLDDARHDQVASTAALDSLFAELGV